MSSSRKFQGQDAYPIPKLAKVIVSPRLAAGALLSPVSSQNSSAKKSSYNNNPNS